MAASSKSVSGSGKEVNGSDAEMDMTMISLQVGNGELLLMGEVVQGEYGK